MNVAVSLETKKLDLMKAIMSVNAESVIDKMTKYLARISKAQDETKMTEEQFYAKIDHSMAQYERGEYVSMKENESLEDFLNRL